MQNRDRGQVPCPSVPCNGEVTTCYQHCNIGKVQDKYLKDSGRGQCTAAAKRFFVIFMRILVFPGSEVA
jgi:hypothetical protein